MIEIRGLSKQYRGAPSDPQGTWISSWGLGLWLRNVFHAVSLSASRSPPVLALDDISLSIGRGEIFGLLGPNGAGKTTLIKILAALLKPTSGTASVDGWDVVSHPERVKRSVSYVSTTGWMGLEWPFNVDESLRFYSRLYGIPRSQARRRIEEVLETVDLGGHRGKVVSQLSHGMRQRLVLARGLLVRTPVVFLDEPTVGLDPVNARHIRGITKSRLSGARRQTVVLTTHNIQEVEEICHRVGILHKGRLIALGTPAELRSLAQDRLVSDLRVRNYAPGLNADLEALPGVLGVSCTVKDEAGGAASLRIHRRRAGGSISDVLRLLRARRVEVSFAAQSEPNLEDVFLELTGANLR